MINNKCNFCCDQEDWQLYKKANIDISLKKKMKGLKRTQIPHRDATKADKIAGFRRVPWRFHMLFSPSGEFFIFFLLRFTARICDATARVEQVVVIFRVFGLIGLCFCDFLAYITQKYFFIHFMRKNCKKKKEDNFVVNEFYYWTWL